MRIGRRVLRVFVWGLLLCVSTLVGGLWFAYWYLTDGETVARLIREHAVKYFPGSNLDPGTVRVSLSGGKVVFRQLRLMQRIDDGPFEVVRIPWLNIRINNQKLAKGKFEAREVEVSQPTLRLRRRRDGTWNLDGLLADPWPGPWIQTPPITIQNGTLELIPDEETAEVAAGSGLTANTVRAGRRGARSLRRALQTGQVSRRFRRSRVRRRPPAVLSTRARRSCAMSTSRFSRREPGRNASSSRERPGETSSRK